MSAPRYLDLPPALQAVWGQVYAAVVGASRVGSALEPGGDEHLAEIGMAAERLAWEAVRRANGDGLLSAGATPEARAAAHELTSTPDHRKAYLALAGALGAGLTPEETRVAANMEAERVEVVLRDLVIWGFARRDSERWYALPITRGAP